ncbi:integrase core domain-containing protein, partial [Escherichia coli]|uniref:integrase core domain-containing protein n=1 Tax=Escherichia coli TaxID=562 RepID=UPI0035902B75
LGLEPKNTAVRSPESNGIAESFVKTIKRDYISIMPKPDGLTAQRTLQRRSSIITNGIRIVRWVIARHGNICGSGLVMG